MGAFPGGRTRAALSPIGGSRHPGPAPAPASASHAATLGRGRARSPLGRPGLTQARPPGLWCPSPMDCGRVLAVGRRGACRFHPGPSDRAVPRGRAPSASARDPARGPRRWPPQATRKAPRRWVTTREGTIFAGAHGSSPGVRACARFIGPPPIAAFGAAHGHRGRGRGPTPGTPPDPGARRRRAGTRLAGRVGHRSGGFRRPYAPRGD
jgi:hypothetical protein